MGIEVKKQSLLEADAQHQVTICDQVAGLERVTKRVLTTFCRGTWLSTLQLHQPATPTYKSNTRGSEIPLASVGTALMYTYPQTGTELKIKKKKRTTFFQVASVHDGFFPQYK